MTDSLLPCPNLECARSEPFFCEEFFCIECMVCNTCGPTAENIHEATRLWNNLIRWFSVDDCLPEDQQKVFFRYRTRSGFAENYGTWEAGDNWFFVYGSGTFKLTEVSHWLHIVNHPEDK